MHEQKFVSLSARRSEAQPKSPPTDIGEAAHFAGVDPLTADAQDWQTVLTYLTGKVNYHSLRSRPDWLEMVVDAKAGMHTVEGWLFGKWGKKRVGSTGEKGRRKLREAMKPVDMTWKAFYQEHAALADAHADVANELDAVLNEQAQWQLEEAARFRVAYFG